MRTVLVVAPHPDDETLGCGGTLLRHAADGDSLHWLVATSGLPGASAEEARAGEARVDAVADAYGMAGVHPLHVPATRLDRVPLAELVDATSRIFQEARPHVVYLPHPGDAHSDHRIVFDMCVSATKWFRVPSLRELLSYETLSETGFHPGPHAPRFRPNTWVDVGKTLERKLEILDLYAGELADFPFPRSAEAVRAQAVLRGCEAGFDAAEAFELLRWRR